MADQPSSAEYDAEKLPELLPILPLFDAALFPKMVLPLVVMQRESVQLVDEAMAKDRIIGLVVSKCGMPLGYEVFDGNRTDVTTLKTIVETIEGSEFTFFVLLSERERQQLADAFDELHADVGEGWGGQEVPAFRIGPVVDQPAQYNFKLFLEKFAQEINYSGRGRGLALYSEPIPLLEDNGIKRDWCVDSRTGFVFYEPPTVVAAQESETVSVFVSLRSRDVVMEEIKNLGGAPEGVTLHLSEDAILGFQPHRLFGTSEVGLKFLRRLYARLQA